MIAQSLESAIEKARKSGEDEVFIIGGGQIFAEALELADRIYLTLVHTITNADVFFPEMEPDHWVEIEAEEHQVDNKNKYPLTFKILQLRN